MNTKPYIINLKFGIWENQLWLEGEDSPEGEKNWENAKSGLKAVAEGCLTSGEYFTKATEYFESCGFPRIQR